MRYWVLWIGCIILTAYLTINGTPRIDPYTGMQHPNIWDVLLYSPFFGTMLFAGVIIFLKVIGGLSTPSASSWHIPSSVRRRSRR